MIRELKNSTYGLAVFVLRRGREGLGLGKGSLTSLSGATLLAFFGELHGLESAADTNRRVMQRKRGYLVVSSDATHQRACQLHHHYPPSYRWKS